MAEKTYCNPLMINADPFVLLYEGKYYLYATNEQRGSSTGFEVFVSDDMSTWENGGYVIWPGCGAIGDRGFWAPEFLVRDGKIFVVYVANEHLAIASATSPYGPFVQEKLAWISETKAIDGHFMVDYEGNTWLYYVRFDHGNVVYCARISDDLKTLDEENEVFLLRAEDSIPWEVVDSHVCEGPFVLKHNGKYYLTFSCNHTRSEDYAVGYAVSSRPDGPFIRYENNPILKKSQIADCTGHHSFVTAKTGELVCVYHSRTTGYIDPDGGRHRRVCVDRAEFVPNPNGGDDILVIHGPTRTPQKAF